ncbi:hypothetical protein AB0M28_23635 [Streptomyces sp. NPDC051940]|uniref:hypothetical protein n=1 Tax=Streptomyces sp. NPDC051940 TaxID=3155675 RepID=UPI003428BA68
MGLPLGRAGGRDEPGLPGGGAPYASLPPRVTDRAVRLAARLLAAVWTAVGLRRAGSLLRHYLRGSGRPYRADAGALLRLPAVAGAVDAELLRWRLEALQRWEDAGGAEVRCPADSGWRGVLITRPRGTAQAAWRSLDWWLALRGVSYRLSGTVRVRRDGAVTVDHRFEVHMNWNSGRGESGPGIPLTPFARLHGAGLAREFTVTGEADGLVYDGTRTRGARVPS